VTGVTGTYVVLLRGVNVGPHKRIAMADLRELLGGLGLTDVRTVLQSGNAVVTVGPADPAQAHSAQAHSAQAHSAVLARRVEQELAERLGLRAGCLVVPGADLLQVVARNPFPDLADHGSRYLAIFLSERPDPALRAEHDPVGLDPDRVRVGERVIYQWCPDGILQAPPVSGFVEKRWRVTATARNWNTVAKLAALVSAP
jgi:uncharacterized protein (DUF1697 family)